MSFLKGNLCFHCVGVLFAYIYIVMTMYIMFGRKNWCNQNPAKAKKENKLNLLFP